MWRPLFRPYFLISVAIYVLIHLGRRSNLYVFPELINSYLTDLLCMPIILTLCLVGVRIIKRIPHFLLTFPMIYGMTAFYALLFEWYLPSQSEAYTQDWWDVLAYFLGATFFYLIWYGHSRKATK